MNADKGFCIVPGIDLGLVYSPGMSALMTAKLPQRLHRDFIVFGQRFTAKDLEVHGVVDEAVPAEKVMSQAISRAVALKAKAKHPTTMSMIKATLYHEAIASLEVEPDDIMLNPQFVPMGFAVVPAGTDRPPKTETVPVEPLPLQRETSAAYHDLVARSKANAQSERSAGLRALAQSGTAS